ncbi:unnamed protein product [Amoebophrya sp. A25]|nr:unnamed protein product [Amoebophrya sp. A25]|eukprot:GSA25T00011850001.1
MSHPPTADGDQSKNLPSGVSLSIADRDEFFGHVGNLCYRKSGAPGKLWAGARSDVGVPLFSGGKFAFQILVMTPGSIRLGWSVGGGSLELGMDEWGFGFGGTGKKSHRGKYQNFGQNFSTGDTILAVLDADRHAIQFHKNGIMLSNTDAFSIPKKLWQETFFAHVLVKEATCCVDFAPVATSVASSVRRFPLPSTGVRWLSDLGPSKFVTSRPDFTYGYHNDCRDVAGLIAQTQTPGEATTTNTKPYFNPVTRTLDTGVPGATQIVQAPWKGAKEAYVTHFRDLLNYEHAAAKEQTQNRVRRPLSSLQHDGYGVGELVLESGLAARTAGGGGASSGNELIFSGIKLQGGSSCSSAASRTKIQESGILHLHHRSRPFFPHLSEVHVGREVMLSATDVTPNPDDPRTTIFADVVKWTGDKKCIVLQTSFSNLPEGATTFRLDLSFSVATFKRMDEILDTIQRDGGSSKTQQKNDKFRMGLLLSGTPLASAVFADIAESSAAALRWDPQQRQAPSRSADISVASRAAPIVKNVCGGDAELQEEEVKLTNKSRGNYYYYSNSSYKPKSECFFYDQLRDSSQGAASAQFLNVLRKSLNPSQQLAVQLAQERRLSFVQGPPGTGKTFTAAAIAVEWLKAGKGPILCTAFSNKGTDNLGEVLFKKFGVNVVRVGLSQVDFSLDKLVAEYGGDLNSTVREWADVVCATCIGAGMKLMRRLHFPYVIIDEAAQVIEPACLIPLSRGCVQAVLVGDQCQLPPTVISDEATRRGLGVSLFDRLLHSGMEVTMLDTQYRMAPSIASFSSARFYHGKLQNAADMSRRRQGIDIISTSTFDMNMHGSGRHGHATAGRAGTAGSLSKNGAPNKMNVNLMFLHVDAPESCSSSSKHNEEEAVAASWVVEQLLKMKNPGSRSGTKDNNDTALSIGVISPYAAQVGKIRRQLGEEGGNSSSNVQVSSVDAFQGSEKDAIVLSLVRSNPSGNLGFLRDWRRLNVALTRSRRFCCVIGNLETLATNPCSITREILEFHWFRAHSYEDPSTSVGERDGSPALSVDFYEWKNRIGTTGSSSTSAIERLDGETSFLARLLGPQSLGAGRRTGALIKLAHSVTESRLEFDDNDNLWTAPDVPKANKGGWNIPSSTSASSGGSVNKRARAQSGDADTAPADRTTGLVGVVGNGSSRAEQEEDGSSGSWSTAGAPGGLPALAPGSSSSTAGAPGGLPAAWGTAPLVAATEDLCGAWPIAKDSGSTEAWPTSVSSEEVATSATKNVAVVLDHGTFSFSTSTNTTSTDVTTTKSSGDIDAPWPTASSSKSPWPTAAPWPTASPDCKPAAPTNGLISKAAAPVRDTKRWRQ